VLADKQLQFDSHKDAVATGKELSERYLKAGEELDKGMIVHVLKGEVVEMRETNIKKDEEK
jgi:hypothetical protein